MMDKLILVLGIIVLAVIVYFIVITYLKKKSPKKITKSVIDIEQLVNMLGGKDNIVSSSHSPSKLTVVLKDNSKTDVEGIKSLGASGIVEAKNSTSMIFGKVSEIIDSDLKEYMK
jgi:phosphotransferase system IIB component